MKPLFKRIKKISIITSSIIAIVVLFVLLFASIAAKYVIEKYDVKYSGREIKLDHAYVNLLTGCVHISGLKIYEANSDSVFFSADEVKANVEMYKLFFKTCELSELTLVKPKGIISQSKTEFNFDDLIKRLKQDTKSKKTTEDSYRVNVLNMKIDNGEVYYYERSIPIAYSLKSINIGSAGKWWNSDTIQAKFSWLSGIGSGTMKGDIIINVRSLDYAFSVLATKFDLSIMEQYLKEISDDGSLQANFDADVKAFGNFSKAENIDAKGRITFNDFHFGKNANTGGKQKIEDYASFSKFTIAVKELSPKNKKYSFDSVALTEPYFKYELYDSMDNLQHMFGKKGQKITDANHERVNTNFLFKIADYVKELAKNFFKSSYKINKIAVYKAKLRYIDYTLTEKFEVSATPLSIFADSIEHSEKWVNLTLRTDMKPYGKVSVDLSVNPKDSSDFRIKYSLRQLPVAMFNPYLVNHSSFPLNKGTIELNGVWNVNNGIIASNNHLVVIDPRIGKLQKKNGTRGIPLRLIMFLVREKGNVIDYQIPITGNLKKPKFKWNDVILDAVTNLFFKPINSSYRARVKTIENEIEESFSFSWERQQSKLQQHQEEFIEELADYLKEFPEKKISITSISYEEKEKEHILFFEAKKLYYQDKFKKRKLAENDTLEIDKISTRDSLFIQYLNARVGKKGLLTLQDKCTQLISPKKVNSLFEKLSSDRKKLFMSYFEIANINHKIYFKDEISKTPYNGLSFYKIEYKGEWPEKLKKAYARMNELDNESPRDKFKLRRKKQNQ